MTNGQLKFVHEFFERNTRLPKNGLECFGCDLLMIRRIYHAVISTRGKDRIVTKMKSDGSGSVGRLEVAEDRFLDHRV